MTAPTTRETADYAELKRLAEALRKPEIWQSYPGPEGDFEIRLAPFDAATGLEAFLSEIAALRGEVETLTTSGIIEVAVRNPSVADYVQHWEGRATQAERQRDELRKALERIARMRGTAGFEGVEITPKIASKIARQALANQGADQ